MRGLTWPAVTLFSVLVAAVTVLGALHIIEADWIERTLSGLVGVAVGLVGGFTIGARMRSGAE